MDGLSTIPVSYGPDIVYEYLVLMPHEDDWRRVDSTSLVVCRHCGQIKPPLGWSSQCWRWVSYPLGGTG